MNMKLAITFLLASLIEAVSFSAWNGLDCRGADVAVHKGTLPYRCYYIGSAASIQAQGLDNHGSEYQIYKDYKCKHVIGFVKYNHLCQNYNFLGVAFYPPEGKKQNVTLPPYGSRDWHVRQEMLLRDGLPLDNETQAIPSKISRKPIHTSVERRNRGDQYRSRQYRSLTGIDEEDTNDQRTANFQFENREQENSWLSIVMSRLRYQENRTQIEEYENSQRVAHRELECDLRANSGTMNGINPRSVTACMELFLRHRTHEGYQRWQFYTHERPLFELTFRAFKENLGKAEASEQNVKSEDVLEDELIFSKETLE